MLQHNTPIGIGLYWNNTSECNFAVERIGKEFKLTAKTCSNVKMTRKEFKDMVKGLIDLLDSEE